MKHLYLILFAISFSLLVNSQPWIDNIPEEKRDSGELTFYEIQKAFNDYWEPYKVKDGYYDQNGEKIKAPYWKQFRRWEWYWENRINPETGKFPKTSAWEELQKYLKENPGLKSPSGNWISLGPNTTSGGYAGLGRLNCVAFVPTDVNTIYVGAASGGIWKTTNGGTSWTPLGDNNPVLGVSDIIVIRPVTGPDIIYIATGDRDGGSMWSLGGGQYNDNNSVGVLKSIDGGATWNTTGLTFLASQQRTVNRMLLDPTNNNILYAASSVGLYKTSNGGTSWSLLTSTHFVDIKSRPVELGYELRCVDPSAFDRLYCSLLGIGVKILFDQGKTGCMVTSDPKGDILPLFLKDVEDENGKVKPRLVDIDCQKSELVFRNNMHFLREADYKAAKQYVDNPEEYDLFKILEWN